MTSVIIAAAIDAITEESQPSDGLQISNVDQHQQDVAADGVVADELQQRAEHIPTAFKLSAQRCRVGGFGAGLALTCLLQALLPAWWRCLRN